jgi:hypothetical protein
VRTLHRRNALLRGNLRTTRLCASYVRHCDIGTNAGLVWLRIFLHIRRLPSDALADLVRNLFVFFRL